MQYVVIDLEWNQYHNPMWTPTSRNGVVMHEEIIQIGAVKTDEHMVPVDCFNLYVRLGGRRRLDRYVKKLTGISEHDIAAGEDFPMAAELFAAWLGDADAIFSWGPDDRRVFLNNLSFHNLEAPSCAWYDAQKIYAAQNPAHGGLALKSIAEECGIRVNLTLHDAMNDAALTAMCMMKLDMEKGIREYARPASAVTTGGVKPITVAHTHRHADRQSAWDEACASLLHCPLCMKSLSWLEGESGSVERWYKSAVCPEHGEFILRGEFQGVKNQTLKLSYFENNDAVKEMIDKELNPGGKKRKRRKRGGKKSEDAVAVVASEDLLAKAVSLAVTAHAGQELLPGTAPYIVHPMEVCAIASTMTDDPAVLSAAMLHDVITQNPAYTADTLRAQFGDHVCELVESVSAPGIGAHTEALTELGEEALILLLSDMLSALRGMNRAFETLGRAFWTDMGPDMKKQTAAYCRKLEAAFAPLSGKPALTEYKKLCTALFGRMKQL